MSFLSLTAAELPSAIALEVGLETPDLIWGPVADRPENGFNDESLTIANSPAPTGYNKNAGWVAK